MESWQDTLARISYLRRTVWERALKTTTILWDEPAIDKFEFNAHWMAPDIVRDVAQDNRLAELPLVYKMRESTGTAGEALHDELPEASAKNGLV